MEENIITILKQYASISKAAQAALVDLVVRTECPRGHLLLTQGNTCRQLYVMESGFARAFYYQDGKDITSWFAGAGEVVTSLYSFVTQKPSFENIELLEDSTLYAITFTQLQQLYQNYAEFNQIGRIITERYYIELEERTLSLQFQSAAERYQELVIRQPQLFQRASLGQIASYLGISQETLSRIRGKKIG